MNVALTSAPGNKIGDALTLSSIPENLFRSNGDRFIDVYNHWIFDVNPFVLRGIKPDRYINLQHGINALYAQYADARLSFANSHQLHSIACGASIYLGGPRLYRFEDAIQKPKSLCVHVSPSSCEGPSRKHIPEHIIREIGRRYSDYGIVQIGGLTDRCFEGAEDKRGTSIWEMAETIASCEIFIGVTSGPMHIADCYPRVRKKIILFTDQPQKLMNFTPRGPGFDGDDWINWNWEYYNAYEVDIGCTRTYLNI